MLKHFSLRLPLTLTTLCLVSTASAFDFVPGSIQGQDGWSGGDQPILTDINENIVSGISATSQAMAPNLDGSYYIRNFDENNDGKFGQNNSLGFAGIPVSPILSAPAGQTAAQNVFYSRFMVRAGNTSAADGSTLEMDLHRADGTNRYTFLELRNYNSTAMDPSTGTNVEFFSESYDTLAGPAVPANLQLTPDTFITNQFRPRSEWITVELIYLAVPGVPVTGGNFDPSVVDQFSVWIDGDLALDRLETFESFYSAAVGQNNLEVGAVSFRQRNSENPSDNGFSDADALGFYIDDLSIESYSITMATLDPSGAGNVLTPGKLQSSYTPVDSYSTPFNVVPEPRFYALLFGGLGIGYLWFMRRKRA